MEAYESPTPDAAYGEVMALGTCCLRMTPRGQNASNTKSPQSLNDYSLVHVDTRVHMSMHMIHRHIHSISQSYKGSFPA